MSARSKARKRALDILFAADARSIDPVALLDERMAAPGAVPVGEYAESLIRGYSQDAGRIDDLISEHAQGWLLDRMPAVDRAILRIAVYELLYSTEVPPAVVVNEAVDAAKVLSTDDSPRFVNGILGQLAVITPQLRGA